MKLKFKNINERWKEYALAGSVCVLLLAVLLNLGGILKGIGEFLAMFSPIFIGFVIAYILNPLAVFFERKVFVKIKKEKLAWLISVILSFVIVLGLFVLLFATLIPQVAGNISDLISNATKYISNVDGSELSLDFLPEELNANVNDYIFGDDGLLVKAGSFIAENLGNVISATSNAGGKAASWVVGIILALYFLLAKEGIKKAFIKLCTLLLSSVNYKRFEILLEKFNSIFSKYIVCEILDSLIVGVANFLFMLVTGMPNALFISVIAAVTNLAPTFGPILGLAISCFFLLMSAPHTVLIFIIFTAVLQTADGYIIKPKLFGGALNVPGVLILVFIIIFSKLMGVSGMLLAIPFAGIAIYLYSEALIPWLELRKDLKQYNKDQTKENQ